MVPTTLRARLVAALVGLFAIGMVVYGVGTYQVFATAELARLDEEVREALPVARWELEQAAGRGTRPWPGPGGPGGAGRPGWPGTGAADGEGRYRPPPRVAPGTYAALHDADGSLVASLQVTGGSAVPDLTGIDIAGGAGQPLRTVGSADGAGSWRVLIDDVEDGVVVLAVPTTSVDDALRGLLLIEVMAGLALLAALAMGSWLVLRAGLRPLERMTAATRSVTAGSMDQRVPVAGTGTEVEALGVAINRMLDDLEDAFAQRAATEAKLRRFVADASHELRTPLTSIQGYAELFRLGADDEHVDTDVILRRIEQESGRMRQLVEDLLTLARLDQPRPLATDPVDLAVLATDACSDAAAIDPDRPIRLEAVSPVRVRGDDAHLRQAVGNLVANALRHTPPGTAVEVSARVEDGQAVLAVRDHGDGLDAEALAHVFDRFWRADVARTGAGTGLGLSIVQAVAAEHGGSATAASHPDGGAVFTLRLPLDAPATDILPEDALPDDGLPDDGLPDHVPHTQE